MNLNRRDFLSTTTQAAIAGISLLQTSSLQAQNYAQTPAPHSAPTTITERSVLLAGDSAPITPQSRIQHLAQLLEKSPHPNDTYLKGGAVEQLEAAMAAMLGKEDAAFLPTGTLANNLAVRLLCADNHHALVQRESHLYLDESDSAQILSGLNLVPLAPGKAAPTYEEIAAAIDSAEHGPYPLKVGAISIESPVRRKDGESVPFAQLERISTLAKQHGIGMHWDGARSLLLSGTPGFDLVRTSALFDTVYVSLYKYLGAPFGAVLAGKKDIIAKTREMRHIYGGLLNQGWLAALPALDALPTFATRLTQARASYELFLTGLQSAGGFTIKRFENPSNINFVQISPERLQGLKERLLAADVYGRPPVDGLMPLYLNLSILHKSPEELVKAFTG
jgi:threonine aldolase